MTLQVLKDELTNDPLGRGYAGMTDQQAADDLNTAYRTRDRQRVLDHQILDAVAPGELTTLMAEATNWDWFKLLLSMQEVPINASNIKTVMLNIFDGVTYPNTRANLINLQTESITRGVELSLGTVHAGDVGHARS